MPRTTHHPDDAPQPWDLVPQIGQSGELEPIHAGPAAGASYWYVGQTYQADGLLAERQRQLAAARSEDDGRRIEQHVRRLAEAAAREGRNVRGSIDLYAIAVRRSTRPLSREERQRLVDACQAVWPELARTAPTAQRRSA